jgi:hypothetical protein
MVGIFVPYVPPYHHTIGHDSLDISNNNKKKGGAMLRFQGHQFRRCDLLFPTHTSILTVITVHGVVLWLIWRTSYLHINLYKSKNDAIAFWLLALLQGVATRRVLPK